MLTRTTCITYNNFLISAKLATSETKLKMQRSFSSVCVFSLSLYLFLSLSLSVCVCLRARLSVEGVPCYYVPQLYNGTAVRASSSRLQTRHGLPGNCLPIGAHSYRSNQSHRLGGEEVNGRGERNTTEKTGNGGGLKEVWESFATKNTQRDFGSRFHWGPIRLRQQRARGDSPLLTGSQWGVLTQSEGKKRLF